MFIPVLFPRFSRPLFKYRVFIKSYPVDLFVLKAFLIKIKKLKLL